MVTSLSLPGQPWEDFGGINRDGISKSEPGSQLIPEVQHHGFLITARTGLRIVL